MPSIHRHVWVWLDHREARIFGVGHLGTDREQIEAANAWQHIHRKADHIGEGKAEPDIAFLDQVAAGLGGFRGILIVGPGTARSELAGHLAHNYPVLAKRVWGIEPADHPSDAQIVALARKYFRAADRMHS